MDIPISFKGVVYKVSNKENGKVYIGMTTREFSSRKAEHIARAKSKNKGKTYFHSALLKHGLDSFLWEVVFESSSLESLNSKEIELIALNNSFGSSGYNLCTGGGTNIGYKHSDETIIKRREFKHTEKTKEEQRIRRLGAVVSEETKEKLRSINLGKKVSEETKEKISLSNKGKGTKKVMCIDTKQVFESVTEAALAFSTPISSISNVVNGKQKTTRGFKFKFFEE